MTNKNTVRLYGCGGTGINICSKYEASKNNGAFAQLDICYIDTSHSNLNGKNIDEAKVHVFDGMDGSGKTRSMNHIAIGKNTLALLEKFKPSKLNIVVHSGSGGSGSVVAPSIVSELKAKGEQVVVLMIGSTDSIIEMQNTYKTLETYEKVSEIRKSSTVVYYVENTNGSRSEADAHIHYAIALITSLYSGQHEGMDSADLSKWLEYPTIKAAIPTIASITFPSTPDEYARLNKVVSVATLATSPNVATALTPPPPYQAVGYVNPEWNKDNRIGDNPVHYVLSFDLLTGAYASLKQAYDKNEEAVLAFSKSVTTLASNSVATDSGLVL